MVKRVHIRGFKSLPDVEVQPRPLTVLVGPNASGKSNFLDALHFLSRLAEGKPLSETFAPPYRGGDYESFSYGPEGLPGLASRDSASFSIEVDLELSPATVERVESELAKVEPVNGRAAAPARLRERFFRYRVEVELVPQRGNLRISAEDVCALTAGSRPKRRRPFLRTERNRIVIDSGGGELIAALRYRDGTILAGHFYRLDPHLIALREELLSWTFVYFEPRQKMRAAGPAPQTGLIGLSGEHLASFLYGLHERDPKQFEAVGRALRLFLPRVDRIGVRLNGYGEVALSLHENGAEIPATSLSEGTLRILGLLAIASAEPPPSLLAIEEPETGVHPQGISLIAEYLRTRAFLGTQTIVTTHSPRLVDAVPDVSVFACRRTGGHTTITPLAPPGPERRRAEIERALEEEEDPLTLGERWERGYLRA